MMMRRQFNFRVWKPVWQTAFWALLFFHGAGIAQHDPPGMNVHHVFHVHPIHGAEDADQAQPGWGFGAGATGVGDVNGDGVPDFAVSEALRDGGPTAVYIVYGRESHALPLSVDPDAVPSFGPNSGFVVRHSGKDRGGSELRLGPDISPAGDVNADGFSDFIVQARSNGRGSYPHGLAYVIFGTSAGGDLDLARDFPECRGFRMYATLDDGEDHLHGPKGLGDVNGDGFDDVGISTSATRSHAVVLGAARRRDVDVSRMPANVGFWIRANAADSTAAPHGLSSAGDFNGDGLADIAIRAPAPERVGEAIHRHAAQFYIVFGNANIRDIPLSLLGGGLGVRVRHAAAGSGFGHDATSIGDVNYDGLSDVVITAPHGGVLPEAYILLGRRDGGVIEVNRFGARDGWILRSDAARGLPAMQVSPAGDIDLDGRADLFVSNIRTPPGVDPGAKVILAPARAGGVIDVQEHDGLSLWDEERPHRALGAAISFVGDIDDDGRGDLLIGAPTYREDRPGSALLLFAHQGPIAWGRRVTYYAKALDRDCGLGGATPGANGTPVGSSLTGSDHGLPWSRLWVRLCGSSQRAVPIRATLIHGRSGRWLPAGVRSMGRSWVVEPGQGSPPEIEVTVSYHAREELNIPAHGALRLFSQRVDAGPQHGLQPARTVYVDLARRQIRALIPADGAREIAIGY